MDNNECVERIKACPYCGNKPEVMCLDKEGAEWSVHCKNCWNGSSIYATREEAIRAYEDWLTTKRKEFLMELCCTWCWCELDDEENESPSRNEDGDVICDDCWSDEYEGTCYRCRETVEKSDLDPSPGHLIIVLEESPGRPADLTPGYYRVKKWPLYSDGVVECYMESNNLVKVADLDDKDRRGEYETERTGMCGPMCKACHEAVEGRLKNSA